MSVVTTDVVTLVVEDVGAGGPFVSPGAGGPFVSPAKETEAPTNNTHTNTKAFSDLNIGTSERVFRLSC
jgi:hypothetical protein